VTHRRHGVVGLVRRYELERPDGVFVVSRANQAAAFLRSSHRGLLLYENEAHLAGSAMKLVDDALSVAFLVEVGAWVGVLQAEAEGVKE
jgi:hypothetical protein